MKKRPLILAAILLVAATSASALSLGRNRGGALIGRPLDISVQAVLTAQEDPAGLCLDADVFYADNRLSSSAVRVTAEKVAGADNGLIRIRAATLVDEPVVTVYLRAGCTQKSERRYVVLAELAPEPASAPAAGFGARAAAPVEGASGISGISRTPSAAAAPAASARASAADSATPRSASRTRSARAAGNESGAMRPAQSPPETGTADAAAPRARNRDAKPAAEKTRARLKLEPLDLSIERDPQLKASSELLSTPAANEQERAAAAALWKSLTLQPQDILRDAEKFQALENSVRNLGVRTEKNQQSINELTGELQKAQSERYANVLVYTLALLLLLAAAAAAFFWRQRFRHDLDDDRLPWWKKNKASEAGWADSLGGAGASALPGDESAVGLSGASRPQKLTEVRPDLDLDIGLDESGFAPGIVPARQEPTDSLPPLARTDRSSFGMSSSHPGRAVKAEELVDVQQQADFFVTLGQPEQAIEVLLGHIGSGGQTSPLIFLDLFHLYYQLNRREEYEALREKFSEVFNARMPAFELYTDASPGLEAYEAAMARIEALWPSPKVLEVIEESIFRRPDASLKAFDLEAYRELLLLYAVAKQIIGAMPKGERISHRDRPQDGGEDLKTVKFRSTAVQPLLATMGNERPQDTTPLPFPSLPKPSPRLGLDIDLSELKAPPSVEDQTMAVPRVTARDNNMIEFELPDDDTFGDSRKT